MPDDAAPLDDESLADLADVILEIARTLSPRGNELRDMVSLTGIEITVIREVTYAPGITPSQVAVNTGIQRSNVSTAIRSLEVRGLLEKRHADGDQRTVELVATELAAENLQRVRMVWAERLRNVDPETLRGGLEARPSLAAIARQLPAIARAAAPEETP